MRPIKILMLGSLGLLGCNPGDFNTILDKAPVQELGTPGASTGSLFVLPLPAPSPTSKVAARMLVSRKDSNYLATADYDMNGKVTLHEASAVESALGFPVNSSAVRLDGAIALGSPSSPGGTTPGGKVTTWSVGNKADGSADLGLLTTVTGGGHMGISVAAGFITGAATGDFVAVGDNSVQLVGADPNVSPQIASSAGTCQILQLGNPTDFYAVRPVVVADLLTPALDEAGLLAGGYDEIVLAGQVGGQGNVMFVQYDGTNVLPCPKKILSLGDSVSFGTSLAAGDFDGDGHMDLAVGAPPNHVYVYFGPLDAAINPDVDIVGSTATQFGKQIAAYQVPGQTTAQLMVADPAVPSPGSVGKVMFFNVARGKPVIQVSEAVSTLFDSNKDSDPLLFGLNLGGMQFNRGLCNPADGVQLVPWASLGPNLFTFFAYGGSPPDPRCFK